MKEIIVGKLMKVKKSLNEEFFLSFGDGEVVTVVSKYERHSYLCKGSDGCLQIVPSRFLYNVDSKEYSNIFTEDNSIEKEETKNEHESLEECLIKISQKDAAILKLKKKLVDRDIEIKLLKKELAKYEV